MKWNHLPMAGGLYDQNPKFLDRMHYIFMKRAEVEAQKRAKEKREMGQGRGGKKGVGRSRPTY